MDETTKKRTKRSFDDLTPAQKRQSVLAAVTRNLAKIPIDDRRAILNFVVAETEKEEMEQQSEKTEGSSSASGNPGLI